MEDDETLIKKGFDKGLDYKPTKQKFIEEYNKIVEEIKTMSDDTKGYINKRRIAMHKLIYLLISMIGLRNGARVEEAVKAFKLFIKDPKLIEQDKKVIVKIAKSQSIKYKKDSGEKYITKPRYRKVKFPKEWITLEFTDDLKFYTEPIKNVLMKQRVRDYLRNKFQCNTHSLRYAFINYMLYEQNKPITAVSKFIGHSNLNMLLTYQQQKNAEQIFDIDM
jgi:hypothetical protein